MRMFRITGTSLFGTFGSTVGAQIVFEHLSSCDVGPGMRGHTLIRGEQKGSYL